ncbi:purine-nucleoside phosphorylase [Desulfovibrio litoralis]|uniref:Purine nucleoside phosphorylase n=1 Tax=Desulfovibrio litoralis DSM 11393 TaxID=1121455 RepID=A0A1M7TK68_9BACT|nr:purine-nucleoside phosphorylase [Desulfovibrio litoralis]SHN71117.1 purine-nucleoside phosphorylase [Desulfovibrio litoralis DSM 11393]
MQNFEKVHKISQEIQKFLPNGFKPTIGIILGTGLGDLAEVLNNRTVIEYKMLSEMPRSTTSSHKGCFIFGEIGDVKIVLQQGRVHLYEGYTPAEVSTGVRVMNALGANNLIVTNAAGCLNPHWNTGSIMLIKDHINFTGTSPLIGHNDDQKGLRFPDMSQSYDKQYQELALNTAQSLKLRIEQGVYLGLKGPELETPAETRMYRNFGADAVGMSTVIEVIAARHLNMRVLGFSCLSNKNLPDCMNDVSLEEIIENTKEIGARLSKLLEKLVGIIS